MKCSKTMRAPVHLTAAVVKPDKAVRMNRVLSSRLSRAINEAAGPCFRSCLRGAIFDMEIGRSNEESRTKTCLILVRLFARHGNLYHVCTRVTLCCHRFALEPVREMSYLVNWTFLCFMV